MTAVQVLKIEEAGPDYIRLRDGNSEVRINFADDESFSKEDSAGFFGGLQGKPAAAKRKVRFTPNLQWKRNGKNK